MILRNTWWCRGIGVVPASLQPVSLSLSPQNPDIVLVHYLNVPAIEDCGKLCGPVLCSINSDRKEWLKWSKEELVGQLKPMCKARVGGRGRCAGYTVMWAG